jgi:acyl-CoA thioesterase I
MNKKPDLKRRSYWLRAQMLCALASLFCMMLLPVATAAAPNTAAPGQTPVILVLGDSLSAEYGLPRGSGWVTLLQQRLAQEKLRFQIVNASISGETTSGGAQRIDALLKQHHPAVVIVELGANDALRGLPLDMTQANLSRMVQASQKAKAQVLLLGMEMPPNFGAAYTQRFRTMFATVAKEHNIALVPFFLEKIGTDLSYFQSDRIHPTEKAQPLLLDTVWPQLQTLLRKAA